MGNALKIAASIALTAGVLAGVLAARESEVPADAFVCDIDEQLDATPAESDSSAEEEQREVILDLVARHRRGASDAWRQRLADAIYAESTEAEVDPLMVASIVAKESSFKSQVVSHAGAVGLMQLRPFVARDVARRSRIEWRGIETLHSPEMNVRLGILYYKELIDRFDGDHTVALTAYNQGPTRVSRNLRQGTYAGSAYAERILGLYASIRDRRPPTASDPVFGG